MGRKRKLRSSRNGQPPVSTQSEKATAQRNELQTKLDKATLEIESAQSQLEDKQSLQGELENVKRAADQAKAQANVQRYLVDPGKTGRQRRLLCQGWRLPDGTS